MASVSQSINMTEGKTFFKIVRFSLPLILSGLLQSLYHAADLMVVGRFDGHTALAAVGSTGALQNLILGLFTGLSVGAGVCVAHAIGAKKEKEVEKILHTAILTSLILGVIVSLLGIAFSSPLLRMMDTPEEVFPLALLYIRIVFLGVPASMLYNYAAAILRSTGDTTRPLIFLATSGLLNVALNLLLVIVFHMGVAGVAIGTIASQLASAVMVTVYLMKQKGYLHLSIKRLRIHGDKLRHILTIGVPSGLQGVLFSFSNVLIQSSINSFGDVVVAGNSACSNLESFIYIAMNAVSQASVTFVGQNVGAGRYDRIRRIVTECSVLTSLVGFSLGVLCVVFREPLIGLYTEGNTAVLEAAFRRVWLVPPTYFLCGIMETLSGALRGMNRSTTAMVVSLLGACGIRLLFIFAVFPFFRFPETVYLSYPVSWIITCIAHTAFLTYFVKQKKTIKSV